MYLQTMAIWSHSFSCWQLNQLFWTEHLDLKGLFQAKWFYDSVMDHNRELLVSQKRQQETILRLSVVQMSIWQPEGCSFVDTLPNRLQQHCEHCYSKGSKSLAQQGGINWLWEDPEFCSDSEQEWAGKLNCSSRLWKFSLAFSVSLCF